MKYKYLLESLLKYLDQGILVVDTKANVKIYNEPATNIAGITPEEVIGKNILDIFKSLTPETSTFYNVLKNKEPLIDYVQTYTNYKGEWVTTVTSTIPLIYNNKIIGAVEIYRNVDDVRELSENVLAHNKKVLEMNCNNLYNNQAVFSFNDIIGESDEIKEMITKAKKVANSSSPILLYGETGTGKELFAHAIHNAGISRCDKPFIAQNCAAFPKELLETILFGTTAGSFTGAKDEPGLMELANGGTLFLDEISLMDIGLQAKLLRALQDRFVRRIGGSKNIMVDVRIIAATNEHPILSVQKHTLREDLYYRLNVLSLNIPSLRERKEDIPILVDYFINMFNEVLDKNVQKISMQAIYILKNYEWPGNIRELKHTIESIMHYIDGDIIEIKDLPPNMINSMLLPAENGENEEEDESGNSTILSLSDSLRDYEITLIKRAIENSNRNYSQAARLLNIPKQTLHNKIKKYDIM